MNINQTQPVFERHIKLETSFNTRDAGGYVTHDGRRVRHGVLFRSDGLHRLSPAARERLLGLGLRTMIDLRTFGEIDEHPNPFASSPHTQYKHLPIFEQYEHGLPPSLEIMYERMFARKHAIRKVFAALAQPNAFPTLVHCVAGKDRTGVVIALLHSLCGVPDEHIAADYALTQQLLMPLVQRLKAKGVEDGLDPDHYDKLLKADPVPFMAAFSAARHHHGGTEAYLASTGITATELDRIKHQLLEA